MEGGAMEDDSMPGGGQMDDEAMPGGG
jgi:hypothetical protein